MTPGGVSAAASAVCNCAIFRWPVALGDVGLHGDRPAAVDAGDHAGAVGRLELDEVADRHQARRRGELQLLELLQRALLGGKAHPDIDLVDGVVGAVFRQLEAGRQHLHRLAEQGHVGAVARRLLAVHGEAPFHARQRQRILDVDEAADLRHDIAHPLRRRGQLVRVDRRQADLDGLALGRPALLLLDLDVDAGDVGGERAHFLEDLGRRAALVPVVEVELQHADRFGRAARRPLLAGGAGIDVFDPSTPMTRSSTRRTSRSFSQMERLSREITWTCATSGSMEGKKVTPRPAMAYAA
jgi:hypothetical protein